jgi:hypothetical protein
MLTSTKARPLSEIANAYLDRVKRLRSWCGIESRTRCHIVPKLGNKSIGEVTRADVAEFVLCHRPSPSCCSIGNITHTVPRMQAQQ